VSEKHTFEGGDEVPAVDEFFLDARMSRATERSAVASPVFWPQPCCRVSGTTLAEA